MRAGWWIIFLELLRVFFRGRQRLRNTLTWSQAVGRRRRTGSSLLTRLSLETNCKWNACDLIGQRTELLCVFVCFCARQLRFAQERTRTRALMDDRTLECRIRGANQEDLTSLHCFESIYCQFFLNESRTLTQLVSSTDSYNDHTCISDLHALMHKCIVQRILL